MFVPKNKLTGESSKELTNYIQEMDIFNSKFLSEFMKLDIVSVYEITRFEYRIDLISKDIYNTDEFMSLLLIFNSTNINELKLGTKLNLFSEVDLNRLILNL